MAQNYVLLCRGIDGERCNRVVDNNRRNWSFSINPSIKWIKKKKKKFATSETINFSQFIWASEIGWFLLRWKVNVKSGENTSHAPYIYNMTKNSISSHCHGLKGNNGNYYTQIMYVWIFLINIPNFRCGNQSCLSKWFPYFDSISKLN